MLSVVCTSYFLGTCSNGTRIVWASFVNTQDASGIPDLLLTVIAMGAFAIGFFFGLFEMARTAAIFALGVLGGFSIGVRFILFRPGLLIPSFVVNWIIIMFFGILGFVLVISRQRAGIVSSSLLNLVRLVFTENVSDRVVFRCRDIFVSLGY